MKRTFAGAGAARNIVVGFCIISIPAKNCVSGETFLVLIPLVGAVAFRRIGYPEFRVRSKEKHQGQVLPCEGLCGIGDFGIMAGVMVGLLNAKGYVGD
jgi:hypothetical protein